MRDGAVRVLQFCVCVVSCFRRFEPSNVHRAAQNIKPNELVRPVNRIKFYWSAGRDCIIAFAPQCSVCVPLLVVGGGHAGGVSFVRCAVQWCPHQSTTQESAEGSSVNYFTRGIWHMTRNGEAQKLRQLYHAAPKRRQNSRTACDSIP